MSLKRKTYSKKVNAIFQYFKKKFQIRSFYFSSHMHFKGYWVKTGKATADKMTAMLRAKNNNQILCFSLNNY